LIAKSRPAVLWGVIVEPSEQGHKIRRRALAWTFDDFDDVALAGEIIHNTSGIVDRPIITDKK
jgi:hypothetical protein